MTTRLPDWLERDLRDFFRERGRGPSEGLRHIAEEWWVREHHPDIEFRDGIFGRRAALREGPEVWEIVMVWRAYEPDIDGLRHHFDWLDPRLLDEALRYYDRFPESVDALVDDNERVGRQLARHRM